MKFWWLKIMDYYMIIMVRRGFEWFESGGWRVWCICEPKNTIEWFDGELRRLGVWLF